MTIVIICRKHVKWSGQKTFFLKILFIHLWETQRESRDRGRGKRSRLHTGSPMQDSIPEPRDHALGQRQTLNCWATQASQVYILSVWICQHNYDIIFCSILKEESIKMRNYFIKRKTEEKQSHPFVFRNNVKVVFPNSCKPFNFFECIPKLYLITHKR